YNQQDDYAGGIEWSGMGISAGVQYIDANSSTSGFPGGSNTGLPEDTEATRIYASYSQQRFGANVSGERIDLNAGAPNGDYVQVNGWFGVLPGTRVAASYG